MKIKSRIILWSVFAVTITANCQKKVDSETVLKYDNYLIKTHWLIKSDKVIGMESSEKEYILYKNKDTGQIWNFSAVDFTDKERFTSYNSWECGNDCFTSVDGKYKFVEEYKVEFQIEKITRTGICEQPVKHFSKPEKLIFDIQKSGDSLILKKH